MLHTALKLLREHGDGKKYIVMAASANMPSSCWGRYGRVAVVEVDREVLAREGLSQPRMISECAVGVVRIIYTWERQHIGTTRRAAFSRAIEEATKMADRLNATDEPE